MVKVTDLGVSAEPMEVLDTPPLPSEIGGAMAALLMAVTGSAGPAVQGADRRDAVALTVRCLRANPGAAVALGIGADTRSDRDRIAVVSPDGRSVIGQVTLPRALPPGNLVAGVRHVTRKGQTVGYTWDPIPADEVTRD